MPANVLVVEDDAETLTALQYLMKRQGYDVRTAVSGEEALVLCEQAMPALVLLDLGLPGIDGMETLRRLKKMDEGCRVVLVTAYERARYAAEAAALGADKYVTKPVPMEELRVLVAGLIGETGTDKEIRRAATDKIVGKSSALEEVFELVRRVAKTATTVLITGESGTGKEAIARLIYDTDGRKDRHFLSLNCASIPANLLEAELFGYEKGAFTDAAARKRGLVEVAGQGTLFLDEIGLMSLDVQAKLLTVLETRQFRRLGGTEELSAGVRFIAATNKSLQQAVEDGEFREDMYYRLNVIPIHLPPLRERREDILLLAVHFLKEYSRLHSLPFRPLSAEAEELLVSYSWPGNVRELKNVIERAVLLTDGEQVEDSNLPIDRRKKSHELESSPAKVSGAGLIEIEFPPWGLPLEDLEREVIVKALKHTHGNLSQTARLLHISRHVLRYRMQKYGIEPRGDEA